ncbi:MAG: T9SS type A sorting domain-containing protein [Candidatus Latescibacteria bacterium]|nr:T9SS type A sorting domain-containing protein [Candidatus Latescibacterota bacterium]
MDTLPKGILMAFFIFTPSRLLVTAAIYFLFCCQPAQAIEFQDESWRLEWADLGNRSPSWVDFNNDGWLDILLGSEDSGGLLVQTPQGRFVELSRFVGGRPNRYTLVAGDYDNDGDQDVYASGFFETPVFLRSDGGHLFEEVEEDLGVNIATPDDSTFVTGVIFADYDHDGDLDLFTGNERGRDTLFRNDGQGRFTDATEEAGLGHKRGVRRALFGDIDNDGDLDLFAGSNKRSDIPAQLHDVPSALYLNDGAGHFTDIALQAGIVHSPREISGLALIDYDNDGWIDLFFTANSGEAPMLFHNNGDRTFTDVSAAAGLADWPSRAGATTGDYDNDGWIDILVVSETSRDLLFCNNGDGTFTEIGLDAGFGPQVGRSTSGTATSGDFDRDGYLDLFLPGFAGPDLILRNRGGQHHWIQLQLVGTQSNRNAFGARVHVRAGGQSMWRETSAGSGYGADSPWVHFGLAQAQQIDLLEVRWPSGQITQLENLPADRFIRLIEGEQGFTEAPPIIWERPLPDTVLAGSNIELDGIIHVPLLHSTRRLQKVTANRTQADGAITPIPLTDLGEGRFQLQAPLTIGPGNGKDLIGISIEQETPLGPWRSALHVPLVVFPVSPLPLYAEGTAAEWDLDIRSAIEAEPRYRDAAHTGIHALRIHSDLKSTFIGSTWFVDLLPPAFFDPGGYRAIRFAIDVGNAQLGEGQLSIAILPGLDTVDLKALDLIDFDRRGWQLIEAPLPEITHPIEKIQLHWDLQGETLIDDLSLVPGSPPQIATAVQELDSPLPALFSLAANYPNPFNSKTVIPFTLSQEGQVKLVVFDMLGRRLRTLVGQHLPGGPHTALWDGKDQAGRDAASGAYLYRLETERGHVSRKLLLLR